jgi:hypothetical protein
MTELRTSEKKFPFIERKIVLRPDLTATLKSLEPGDYVHCGIQWGYGTIREIASKLGISISTRRSGRGITVMRNIEVPEPK